MRRKAVLVAALVVAAFVVALDGQTRFADIFRFNGGPGFYWGSVDPEGARTAPAGSVYLRTAGCGSPAACVYFKGSGSGNTGWVLFGSGAVTASSTFGTDERLIRSDGTSRGVQASSVSLTDAGVITGLKFNVEGSGNELTITAAEKYVPAGCQAGAPTLGMNTFSAGTSPTAICISGTNTARAAAEFPDVDGDYHLEIEVPIVKGTTTTADFYGHWRTTATTNAVVIQLQQACTSDGETLNDSWTTIASTTETSKGTTLQINQWSITGATLTGCGPDDLMDLRILRNRTHVSDTLGESGGSATFQLLPFYGIFRIVKSS
jgi:hypothetical protein